MKNLLALVLFFTVFLPKTQAQIVFSAELDNNVITIDDQVQLVYSLNAQPSSFKAPDLSNFDVSGPFQSSSNSIEIINGKTKQTTSFSYTYLLQPKKAGKFTISPASATVGGKNLQSNAVNLEVIKGSGGNTNNTNGNHGGNNSEVSGKDLYVSINLDKTSVYQGEAVVATIKIYTRVQITNLNINKMPPFTGLWNQDIPTPQLRQLDRENVNGVIYNTGVVKRILLFPQRTGEITIDPLEMVVVVRQTRQRRSIWDMFDDYQDVEKKISSIARKITVKPLPTEPTDFSGAVGNFKMNASLNKTNAKTGDAISLKINVSGKGNLKLIDQLKLNIPPDFETYDPKIEENITNSVNGSEGSKTFEYLLIPRQPGDFKIPAVTFTYFDLASKTYKTLSSDEFNLHIEKGNGDEATISSAYTKEDVKFIGSDIRFIKNNDFSLYKKESMFFGSSTFFGIYLLMLGIFGLFVVFMRKRIKENSNMVFVKNKRASKVSRKRLKQAAECMKNGKKEEFYTEISAATWGYLSDKLAIPAVELNKENIAGKLEQKSIDKDLITKLITLLDTCEFARYAPSAEIADTQKIYDEASEVINKLEQTLK